MVRTKVNQPEQSKEDAALPTTARDRENARVRQAIADVQERQWQECYLLARVAFGPGWEPSCRHFLVDKAEEDACRKSGEKPRAAATVYTVKKEGQKRHFSVEDGTVVEHDDYRPAFGPMLFEPHPTQTIEVRGQIVHPHRYSLCLRPVSPNERGRTGCPQSVT